MKRSHPPSTPVPERPRTLLAWRLLSLLYDFWPCLAMWMLIGVFFTVGYYLAGHGERENIPPFSALQLLSWLLCWIASGAYTVLSWRYGGQTLGMRPWRLRLVNGGSGPPGWRALLLRYLVGTASLLAGGLGFWWAWIDRDRLTWHDRASSTRLVREPKRR